MPDKRPSPTSTSVVPFLGYGDEGADAWVRMHKSDRRRIAMEAARNKDMTVLLSLTEAWLRTYSKAGATIAKGTIGNHTHGVRKLLAAWTEEDLLTPDTEAATRYIRAMERQGLKPGTIYGRVAAARTLFSALRWARAPVRPLRRRACAARPDPALGEAQALRQRRDRGAARQRRRPVRPRARAPGRARWPPRRRVRAPTVVRCEHDTPRPHDPALQGR